MIMSYKEAEHRVQNGYQTTLLAGEVTPVSSLMGALNFGLLIGWLMVCPSISNSVFNKSRWPVFLCIAYVSMWNLLYTRSPGVIGSIGVGLNSVMCTIMATNFMLFHDPRSFKRAVLQSSAIEVARRKSDSQKPRPIAHEEQSDIKITWEPIPKFGWRRLVWVLDLISGLRGVHWTWKTSPLPKFPSSPANPPRGINALFSNNIVRFSIDYLLFDIIKCTMLADPYFIGYPMPTPPPHLALYIRSPLCLYLYRMLLATAGGFVAIDMIYTLGKLLQVNILGTQLLGLNAHQSTFPPLWGSGRAVLHKGLRGFWGETWHQMLRLHLASVGDAVADIVLRKQEPRGGSATWTDRRPPQRLRTIIRVSTVFGLSGVLHAAAAHTLLGPANPRAFFFFFALQPVGMVLQSVSATQALACYPSQLPLIWKRPIRQAANLSFTLLWLSLCAPLMLDGFTSGGLWMLEPVPVSFVRGFGFSAEEKRFWCW